MALYECTLHLIAYTIGCVIGVGIFVLLDRLVEFLSEDRSIRKARKQAAIEFEEWKANLVYGELPPWSEEYGNDTKGSNDDT